MAQLSWPHTACYQKLAVISNSTLFCLLRKASGDAVPPNNIMLDRSILLKWLTQWLYPFPFKLKGPHSSDTFPTSCWWPADFSQYNPEGKGPRDPEKREVHLKLPAAILSTTKLKLLLLFGSKDSFPEKCCLVSCLITLRGSLLISLHDSLYWCVFSHLSGPTALSAFSLTWAWPSEGKVADSVYWLGCPTVLWWHEL